MRTSTADPPIMMKLTASWLVTYEARKNVSVPRTEPFSSQVSVATPGRHLPFAHCNPVPHEAQARPPEAHCPLLWDA